ncbi:MAG: DUF4097 family beta strand repeat protein [Woeseiaceae bacterium]|nr:DUF4097 family beta strand repeat protein [Woeseiaceae bacterium]
MKKLTVLITACLLLSPVFAEEVDRKLTAAAAGQVDISNIAGSVKVNGWSRNEVEVTGTLGPNVEELIFERDDDTITIKVKVPRKSKRGIDSDLRISVPEASSIDVSAVSADIDVADVLGEQQLHTVSGDVQTEAAGEDIVAASVSGDVEVSGSLRDIEMEASTVSGDVTLFRIAGEVSAESVSGDVIVDEGAFDRVDLSTVNGDVLFQAALREGGKLSAETVNGDISVDFVGDVSARIDVSSFNGKIRNCFGPDAERSSKYTPGWSLEFTAGDGDGRVDISTMNGGIRLCRD